jgi:hypothetical protein
MFMFKKIFTYILLLVILSLPLAACAGAGQAETVQTTLTPGVPDPNQMNEQSMLLVGTLKLEGTDLAVTPEQAVELLPLWKAVKTLGSSDTVAQEEIDALYAQIKETMTVEQMAAIDAMTFTREDLSALMTQLGIENTLPGGGSTDPSARATQMAEFQSENPDGGNIDNIDPSVRATRIAGSDSETPGMGRGPGGGGPPGGGLDDGGITDGTDSGGFQPPVDAQGTPVAGLSTGRRNNMGMSQMFLDPLITLLEGRAAGG